MRRKTLKTLFLIIGILAIGVAVVVPCLSVGRYESHESYGGDAYTGIQNAAADTANNILYVGEMLQVVFSSLLAIHGLVLISLAICIKTSEKQVYTVAPQAYTVADPE